MDIVQNEKILINALIAIYSEKNFLDDLSDNAKNVTTKLKTLLDDQGEKYELLSRNSVRDLKYFSLVYRIKEPDSLKEKFYRSNLLQKKFKSLKLTSGSNVRSKINDVRSIFKKCDDVVGVKILTDLNEDCKKVIMVLRSSESYLKNQRITLDKKDLSAQPSIMKNGLEIYKIRGEFNEDYSFELQIKSKIVSAWGDMEHAIFYKDYFISPVRETTQATMNHIGKLLFQIDDFLLSVRNANKEFKSNAEVISFLSWFDNTYSDKINTKLGGVGFKIDSISEALYYIRSQRKSKVRELQFDHFKFKPLSDVHKNYVKIRNSSYDLKIFESIVFSWLWTKSQITNSNIDTRLKTYFTLIFEFLATKIKVKIPGLEIKAINKILSKYFFETLSFEPSASVFLSPNEYVKHLTFISFARSKLELLGIENYLDYLLEIDLLLFIKRMDGNIKDLVAKLKISKDKIENFREILSKVDLAIKLEGKGDFKNESIYINELITELK